MIQKITENELGELERVACPSAGSWGQFTANTMACGEAIGLALPGSSSTPAPYESRDSYAFDSGFTVMELIKKQIKPRDIVTKEFVNAARIVACRWLYKCSTSFASTCMK